ncbi:MAG: UpxY family transcription antiterminator [Desulfobacterales bacterium]|jgi:transcriptional antiterminator NusG
MNDRKLEPLWYVLHTKSRHEKVVNDGLLKKSIEVYLPLVTVRSRRRDRRVMIRVPLFPGYIFVKTDLHPTSHLEVVKTAGAVRLIGNNQGPVPVPDETVHSLQIMVESNHHVTTGYQLKSGDQVMVVYGPFTGVVGTFVRYGSKGRVIVNIEALGQYAGVEVNEEDIEIIPKILS